MTSTRGTEELLKAKECALRLLKVRSRTCAEMRARLAQKGFPPAVAEKVVDDFGAVRLLDDRAFANALAERGVEKAWALARIRAELEAKGIGEAIIDEALTRLHESYDEAAALRALVANQKKAYARLDPLAAKRRLFHFLAQRGFDPEKIRSLLGTDDNI